ncbi:MAG: CPBP family intramembrane glutamic endopeptidase [Candidatus Kariarchaeaceae archaeon]|jgi:membrane protease YdiL (CAAX protease family)
MIPQHDKTFWSITGAFLFFIIVSQVFQHFEKETLALLIEVIGFTLSSLYAIRLYVGSENILSAEVFGIKFRQWVILLIVATIFSVPFWFDSCININNRLQFASRALGEYSYSTLVKAPIFEEFYFRGVFLVALNNQFSDQKSALLNGLCFSLLHLPIMFFTNYSTTIIILLLTGFLGYILARIQLKYENLFYPILLHFISNLLLILISYPSIPSMNSCQG